VRFDPVDPPREFEVGYRGGRLRHVSDAWMDADEVLTLRTESGTEFDVTRKSWGYYATPSLNRRAREYGLRAALTLGVPRDKDEAPRMYVMLVEAGSEGEFTEYLEAEGMRLVCWLDDDDAVQAAVRKLEAQ
jgi:hypothetical protein